MIKSTYFFSGKAMMSNMVYISGFDSEKATFSLRSTLIIIQVASLKGNLGIFT